MSIFRLFSVRLGVARRAVVLVGLLGAAMLAPVVSGGTPALADTSKPIKFLLSPGVDGHTDRCLQERVEGSYGMQLCTLLNPPPWQRWSVTVLTSTRIKLTSAWGTCASDVDGNLRPEGCFSPVSRQEWNLKYMADGRIEVRNAYSGRCLHYSSFEPSVQVSSCLAPVVLNSRWWLWPVSNTSTTNNQWRSAGRCAEVLLLGDVAGSVCANASATTQMFNPVPVSAALLVGSGGASRWRPPLYQIESALPGDLCVRSDSSRPPASGQVFDTIQCDDLVWFHYFMIQVLPGLRDFRMTAGLDGPCLIMDNRIDRPVFADCVGTLPTLDTFPTYHRWQFVGLTP